MRVRLLAATTVILALSLTVAQPAGAISRAKAQKVALAAFKANAEKGPVIVFGLPKPLPKGAAVSEAGPGPSHRGKTTTSPGFVIGAVETFTEKGKRLPAGTWLFWEDLAPFARFEHSSRMVLVNARGKVVRNQPLAWWPTVNGKAPAFIAPAAYRSARYRVFAHGVAAPQKASALRAQNWLAPERSALTAAALPNDCIILLTDEVDPIFTGDIAALKATATTLGIPFREAQSAADLASEVTELTNATPPCTDVVLYLDAHGYPATGSGFSHNGGPIPESDHAQVALKHTSIQVDGNFNFVATTVTELVDAEAVRKVMSDHRNVTFKLVVDACFAGRWEELSDQPNLRVVLAASRKDQMSFGYIANGDHLKQAQANATIALPGGTVDVEVQNPNQAGGFTNAITQGLETWATGGGVTDLADGLVKAYDGAPSIDASQLTGLTEPEKADFHTQRPHASPPAQPFGVSVVVTYRHISSGHSELCVQVATTPQRPGSALHLQVGGPGVVSGADKQVSLDASGAAFVRVPINQYGDYTAGAQVTAGSLTEIGAGQETVTSSQGTCAAP